MKHIMHIDFNDNKHFIVDKNSKMMVVMGVEEQSLFQLLNIENKRLVQRKDGCSITENSAMMPKPLTCQVRQSSQNEALDYIAAETSSNQQRREGKQQIYYALSAVIHKKNTIREGKDDGVFLETQT
jgi:hypothetical protein